MLRPPDTNPAIPRRAAPVNPIGAILEATTASSSFSRCGKDKMPMVRHCIVPVAALRQI
jgi:hypothetical protein